MKKDDEISFFHPDYPDILLFFLQFINDKLLVMQEVSCISIILRDR